MTRDFEGKTEQDAINQAIEALHIEREDFDVEILDNGRRGLFKKANVKIRVHIDSAPEEEQESFIPEEEDFDQEEEDMSQRPLSPPARVRRSTLRSQVSHQTSS